MEIVLKSFLAGAVTALILLVAKFSGPKLAGALGGVPIVFAVSYVLVTLGDKSVAREFLIGGIFGAIAGIFFSLILIWFNQQFVQHHWINFIVAYILSFIFVLALVHFTSK